MGRPRKSSENTQTFVSDGNVNKIKLDFGTVNPKQAEFFKSKALYTAYGGARGGGKSWAVQRLATLGAVKYAGIKILIVRRQYSDLLENHIEPLKKFIPQQLAEYNNSTHVMYFINGSTIKFGHFNYDSTAENYQGQEYDWIFMDEGTQFTEMQFRMLGGCLRGVNKIPKRFYVTCNPGGVGHCVPYGEVLTPNGWRDIREISVGDAVYTVSPEKQIETECVSQLHRARATVNYVNMRGLHMALTDEHRVMTADGKLVEFCKLPGQATIARSVEWLGKPIEEVDISSSVRARTPQPKRLSGMHFAELMGWFLSEGCLVDRDYLVSIAQTKPDMRLKIISLLDNAGLTYCEQAEAINIYGYGLWSKLKSYELGLCREKYIPDIIKNSTHAELDVFMRAAVNGDGHWASQSSGQYYTASKRLADDMQDVFIKLGYITTLSSRQRDNRVGLSYCVSFKKTKSGGTEILTGNHTYNVQTTTKRKSDIRTGRSEDVYCIGVEKNHAFILRQNGSVWISGNSWVKRLFINRDFKTDSENPEENENPKDYKFIFASVEDNAELMEHSPAYVQMLSSLPEKMRAAHRYGDWDALGGAYFDEFSTAKHVVKPFAIPDGWRRYRAFDYGFDMFACYWVAVDHDGRSYVYREFCKSDLIVRDAAKEIHSHTLPSERIEITFAPPDMWNRQRTDGKTMAEDFLLNDVSIIKVANDRTQGALQMKNMLADMEDGKPGLLIFDNCKRLIDDLAAVQCDEKDPNKYATEPHDITHTVDGLRYYCVSRQMAAVVEKEREESDYEEDEAVEEFDNYLVGGEVTQSYMSY